MCATQLTSYSSFLHFDSVARQPVQTEIQELHWNFLLPKLKVTRVCLQSCLCTCRHGAHLGGWIKHTGRKFTQFSLWDKLAHRSLLGNNDCHLKPTNSCSSRMLSCLQNLCEKDQRSEQTPPENWPKWLKWADSTQLGAPREHSRLQDVLNPTDPVWPQEIHNAGDFLAGSTPTNQLALHTLCG